MADVLAAFRLDRRVALVTGGGRGLGRAMAHALAQAGADVVIWDIHGGEAEEACAEVEHLGGRALPAQVDVGDEGQVEAGIGALVGALGGLHVVVNNAGVTSNSPLEQLKAEDWESVLRVNLTGVFHVCKWAARQMLKQGDGGSMINIASISALVGNRGGNNSHYCATKGGLLALTRSLAVEWAPHAIRMNALAPGYFVTPMTDRLKERDPGFYHELIGRVPLGRFGLPPDLAGAVVYLASPASSYVTGQMLVVDGGYTAW
jgi:NAD(P)-dependent dehydrogenase (short-subunit alcohol dehydrogenase family)